MSEQLIDSRMTVNDVLHKHPTTVSVFHEFGIDACCGGAASLEEVARRHRLDLITLVAALEAAA